VTRSIALVGLTGILSLAAGCASSPPPTPSPVPAISTAAPTQAPTSAATLSQAEPTSSAQLLAIGTLAPGTYRTNTFDPTLVFTLPAGWHEFFPDDEDEVALGGPDAFMNMTRPTQVIDPEIGTTDAPDDLLTWLTEHPGLRAQTPVSVTVAGIESSYLDLESSGGRDLPLFHYATGNMRIPAGAETRLYVVPLEGPDLVLMMGDEPPPDHFDEAVALSQPIIESLRLVP
jgi:hypothetical protein